MKTSSIVKTVKPFFKDAQLEIRVMTTSENKISSFDIVYKGKEKKFVVKDFDILAAWQAVEKHLSKIK